MEETMNGAEAVLKTLIESGVEVCFANPGTSEMQLVAAIDKIPGMRPVLGLFEGVVTGAADGYGRMADKPAATLLHVGSGLANGMANLHNAKRARTPIVNMIGDHATYHLPLDAPLTSDVPTAASLTTDWMRVCDSTETMGARAAEAVAASMAGRQANLVVPADLAWTEGGEVATAIEPEPRKRADALAIERAAELLLRDNCCLFLGGMSLREQGLKAAERIRAVTGVRLIHENAPSRVQRGEGRPTVQRLPYLAEMAVDVLKDFDHMVLAGAKAPVAFFAYPNLPGELTRPDCVIRTLAEPEQDVIAALEDLADYVEKKVQAVVINLGDKESEESLLPEIPTGKISAAGVGAAVANLLPKDAVISDEAITSGAAFYEYFDAAAPHDWLNLTGGAIGQGLPLAVGAAIACPEKKVVSLQADGSAMYTNQALWTMARENLDICVVVFNNSRYAILELEFSRVGVQDPGPRAKSMLDIGTPAIDWCHLAAGMGVEAKRAETMDEFVRVFSDAMSSKGPRLIEVVLTT